MQSWNTPYSTYTLKTDCFAQVKSNTTYIIAVVYIQAVFLFETKKWNKNNKKKQFEYTRTSYITTYWKIHFTQAALSLVPIKIPIDPLIIKKIVIIFTFLS